MKAAGKFYDHTVAVWPIARPGVNDEGLNHG
jgi:hypothetical protein